ncbi:Glycosyl hydrolases family 43 [Algoriphagus boritolerans DSM 17298 = JCM 18970]|uniref:Glycosyl hydrolases family 43 n=2 Tax=Algoriphagus TaxID=246875 RepID=A0A1H5SH59_9BACT|nr:Glycosyl hydrolases family 43 [Algoriphagus boritolerans DSM 17298 = JCM 18970]
MMKMRIITLSFFVFLIGIGLAGFQTDYQHFFPGKEWKDDRGVHINAHGGGFLIHEDTYYWFGEHKIAGKEGNKAHVGVRVYSSKDLYNWKNEGIALEVHEDPNSLLVQGCVIERPKVIYNEKTRKFVMWFHHELKGQGYDAALTGVAVSDQVTGPYTYIKSVNPHAGIWPTNYPDSLKSWPVDLDRYERPSEEWKEAVVNGIFLRRDFEKGQMARDMTLFVDDDGKAYHFHSSENNQTLHVAELTDDYTDFSGKYTRVLPGLQNEAPAIFKKEEKYYMFSSGLTGWKPNPGKSAVADHPLGPWTPLGNPTRGTDEEMKTTFWSQSTAVIPVMGKEDAFIFVGDRWTPENPIDGKYIFLPVEFENSKPIIHWQDQWDLSFFDQNENTDE